MRALRLRPAPRLAAVSLPRWWAAPALAALLAAGAAVLVHETRGTFFWADDWQWILTRRGGGLDTFLTPHNEHFSLVPVALYKILFAVVGLRHYWPYRGLLIATELILAALIFVYARRRVGELYALLAAASLLFFGPGWQNMLWPFQTAWILTMVGGVGALLALDRRSRWGDVSACLLLALALASASPGLAVAAGLIVEVLWLRPRRDLWIVGLPVAGYALWWLLYQQTSFDSQSLLLVPRFVFDSAAGTLSSLTGLAQDNPLNGSGNDFLSWGTPLLLAGVAGLAWRLRSWGRIPPRVVTLIVILIVFWTLTGIGRAYVTVGPLVLTATGDESRYLFIGAVFVLLLVVELVRVRASAAPVAAAVVTVLAVAAIVSNWNPLREGAQLLRTQAQYTTAELEAMNMDRDIVAPSYVSNGFVFQVITARAWFAAERDLGSPPLSVTGLEAEPEPAREAADSQFVHIQGLALRGAAASSRATPGAPPALDAVSSATSTTRGGCVNFAPDPYTPSGAVNLIQVTVPSAGLVVRSPRTVATVSLRRFAAQFAPLGTVAAGATATLAIRPDLGSVPWHAQVSAAGPVSICAAG